MIMVGCEKKKLISCQTHSHNIQPRTGFTFLNLMLSQHERQHQKQGYVEEENHPDER